MTHVSFDGRLEEVLRTLADRVRRLREERGLTLLQLSYEAGLSESRLRAIETGRTTASLATLVALADTFEVEVAELFGEADRRPPQAAAQAAVSAYVVPSEVVWGGELPPAPWLAAEPAPAVSPYVVPSEVVWGGELPAAPWTSATPAPTMPGEAPVVSRPSSPSRRSTGPDAAPLAPGATRAESSSAAPWVREALASVAAQERTAPPSAEGHPRTDARPYRRAVEETSPYVVVAAQSARRQPRTFADLREGALAGREFASLRHFAVAAVVEGGFSTVSVARVFRLPAWKLEQWVLEAGHVRR